MTNAIRALGIAPDDSIRTLQTILDCQEINCIRAISNSPSELALSLTLPFSAAVMYSPKLDDGDCGLLEQLYMARKDIITVLLTDTLDYSTLERAMECGVNKVISADEEPDTICMMIVNEYGKAASRTVKAKAREFESTVLCFYSVKGGTGKSLCAVNVANILAKHGKKVAVVDASLQFGDVATYLDMPRSETIAELAQEPVITPATIRNYLRTVPDTNGMEIILAPSVPEQSETVTPEMLTSVISSLRSEFDYVILDLSPGFSRTSIAALASCDAIYYILTPEISSIKTAQTCMTAFEQHGFMPKVKFLLNKNGHSKIREEDIESTVNAAICGSLSYDADAAIESCNDGIPVVDRYPYSKLSKDLYRFVSNEFRTGEPQRGKTLFGMRLR